jgi:hypothetical protein
MTVGAANAGGVGVFAQVLDRGEVLADNGQIYPTVSEAKNATGSTIWVGPGVFDDSISPTTDGFTIVGVGRASHIRSPDANTIDLTNSQNSTVKNVRVDNTSTSTALRQPGIASGCYIEDGKFGLVKPKIGMGNTIINTSNNTVTGADIFEGNFVQFSGSVAFRGGPDDAVISNNFFIDCGRGVYDGGANDWVIIGNRCINNNAEGIWVIGTDSIIANNRSSDNNQDIVDGGTGTVLDANITGPSN